MKIYLKLFFILLVLSCQSKTHSEVLFSNDIKNISQKLSNGVDLEYQLIDKNSVKYIDGIIIKEIDGKFYKAIYNGVINVKWFREKFKGDGSKMLQEAINVATVNDVLVVEGEIKCDRPISINKTITITGNGYVNSNDTHEGSNSRIFFNSPMKVCIESGDVNFKNLTIAGNGVTTKIGIKAKGFVTLQNVTVQMFDIGIYISEGYYNKFSNSVITYCNTNLILDKCYNTNANNVGFNTFNEGVGDRTNIILLNHSNLNLFGCSIESFNVFGVDLKSGSRLNSYSTYFEGKKDTGRTPVCANLGENASVSLLGSHVYLTDATGSSFVNVDKDIKVFSLISKNNYFEDSQSKSSDVIVYNIQTSSPEIIMDISGDVFRNKSYIKYTSIKNKISNKISIKE